MSRPTCTTCAFRDDAGGGEAICRRNPPQNGLFPRPIRTLQGDAVAPHPVTSWPMVREDDWCGEHRSAIRLAS